MNNLLLKLGETYKYVRETILHLSQDELAERLCITQSTVSFIEKGRINITKIEDICSLANISVKDFFDIAFSTPETFSPELLQLLADVKKLNNRQVITLKEFLDSMRKGN